MLFIPFQFFNDNSHSHSIVDLYESKVSRSLFSLSITCFFVFFLREQAVLHYVQW